MQGDPGRFRTRMRGQSGFTILEFLLVVVLISILAAIIVPRFDRGRITQQEVYVVAHNIAKDLRKTRHYAIGQGEYGTEGRTDLHSTDPTFNQFIFELSATGAATDTWKVIDPADAGNPVSSFTLPDDTIRISSAATDTYLFDNLGAPSPAAGGVIEVTDFQSRYQWNVSVVKNTGRIMLVRIK